MSVKSRLRALETSVEWLNDVGRYRGWAQIFDILDRKQELADQLARSPNSEHLYGGADWIDCLNLPPPRPRKRAPRPEPIKALGLPSANRDASLRAAPQDEEVRVATASPPLKSPEPTNPHPEEPSEARRLEGWDPAPPPVESSSYDPPPDMQIRPVQWRQRGPQDRQDDGEDMYGRCIVDYDPLGYLDDDDD